MLLQKVKNWPDFIYEKYKNLWEKDFLHSVFSSQQSNYLSKFSLEKNVS